VILALMTIMVMKFSFGQCCCENDYHVHDGNEFSFWNNFVVEMIIMNHDDYDSYYNIVHVVKSCLD
jgi:hypothetical protein